MSGEGVQRPDRSGVQRDREGEMGHSHMAVLRSLFRETEKGW